MLTLRRKTRKRRLAKRNAYQIVVKEGSAKRRPLKGVRLFDTKAAAMTALGHLAPYQDDNTRMGLRKVRA